MNSFKMKSTLLIALFMIVTLSSFGSYFSGKKITKNNKVCIRIFNTKKKGIVVAKLPFSPFSLLTSLTHRGLIGEDMTDCAYIFIYVQAAYIWRTNI